MKLVNILIVCTVSSFTFGQEVPSKEKGKVKQTKSIRASKSLDKSKNLEKVVFIPAKKPVKK